MEQEVAFHITDRKQKIVLNGQTSPGGNVLADVPQNSVLGPLLFLIYVNDLPDRIMSTYKIFAFDTSLFSKFKQPNLEPNDDLNQISKWVFQWKMLFNPIPTEQAIEVCFSNKRNKAIYPPLIFNNDIQYNLLLAARTQH